MRAPTNEAKGKVKDVIEGSEYKIIRKTLCKDTFFDRISSAKRSS